MNWQNMAFCHAPVFGGIIINADAMIVENVDIMLRLPGAALHPYDFVGAGAVEQDRGNVAQAEEQVALLPIGSIGEHRLNVIEMRRIVIVDAHTEQPVGIAMAQQDLRHRLGNRAVCPRG